MSIVHLKTTKSVRKSPDYFCMFSAKREILSGYALPFSVLSIAFLAKHFIDDLPVEKFDFSQELGDFELSPLEKLQWWGWGLAFTIGFFLSVLLFIEQNVAASLVCSEHNKIQKVGWFQLS